MKIEYIKVKELQGYEFNTRTHSDEQVAQLAASITEFGFTNPLLIDGERQIIAGHGRLMAAKKVGMDEVPCVVLDHLSDEQRRAYVIADNKLALNAGWDEDLLKQELSALNKIGFDLSVVGFDRDELSDLIIDEEEVAVGLTDEDEIPETSEIPVTKLGDTWILGNHRLMCGDSTDEICVAKLTQDISLDKNKAHFISDPPYGIAYDPKIEKYGMIKNDDVFLDFISLGKKYTNGFFFMWTSYQVVDEWIARIKKDFDKITNMIIWHKGGGGMGDLARTLTTDFEIALVVNRKNNIQSHRGSSVWTDNLEEKRRFLMNATYDELADVVENIIESDTIWRVSKDNTGTYLHPTQKPVEVNERALINFTSKRDYVVDLFLGSGSNLIACEKNKRQCYGMELDEHYCDVIIKRWQNYTGREAVHEVSGLTFDEVADAKQVA